MEAGLWSLKALLVYAATGQFEGSSRVEYCFGRNAQWCVISNSPVLVFVSRSVNSKWSLPVSSSKSWISDHLSLWSPSLLFQTSWYCAVPFCLAIPLGNLNQCSPSLVTKCCLQILLHLVHYPLLFVFINSLRLEIRTLLLVENSLSVSKQNRYFSSRRKPADGTMVTGYGISKSN